ncbi:hypothetical protein LTR78_006821 [Recurvomyces mirabilis]|uniref:HTH APSES-type domain-containing protein n=1 Tax=Recurvomyces mirabilis TaxID=574656 RepID=A0AAE0WKA5_9PEZI|nr:hypothetical protein LTR78_006821 [Recurvomyces mirabilis]KAK5153189.1 hypothetical protein LTS14_007834 [Recurvomyces mirabilis]
MSPTPEQLLSPCLTDCGRADTAINEHSQPTTTSKSSMMKIDNMLNPYRQDVPSNSSSTPPSTPSYSQARSSPDITASRSPIPFLSPQKRQKQIKDGAIFKPGTPTAPVEYPPKGVDDLLQISEHRRAELVRELAHQHAIFQIYPGLDSGRRVEDCPRRIPYSSDKKTFAEKTAREAVEVFEYTFQMPNNPEKKHVVMWDYQIGLVRITPFFKALDYSKTAPAKALGATQRLKDLAHSITGGALAAQGYWLPYQCARSLCITFCYHIRWALTPIFGVDFVEDCLMPEDPWYGRFRISGEVVRYAEREAESWKHLTDRRVNSPVGGVGGAIVDLQQVPRSVPPTEAASTGRELRQRPTFSARSAFDIDINATNGAYTHAVTRPQSPGVSPRSSPAASLSGWTSINSPALQMPALKIRLSPSLLTQPRETPIFTALPIKTERLSHKRRQSAEDGSDLDYASPHSRQSQTLPATTTKKRQRRKQPKSARVPNWQTEEEAIYTSEDERAALMLLQLNKDDARLAHR